MLGYRIVVDGKDIGILAEPGPSTASVYIDCDRIVRRQNPRFRLTVGGLNHVTEGEGYFDLYDWAMPEITVGSRIEIEIVDSIAARPPTKRRRVTDVDNPTPDEIRAGRYEVYLELKEEFEDNVYILHPDAPSK